MVGINLKASYDVKAQEIGVAPNYGIIFGGYLLSKDDFIKVFKDFYMLRKNELKQCLMNDVLSLATEFETHKRGGGVTKTFAINPKAYNADDIYARWESIAKDFFGNGATTILAGVNFDKQGWQWTQIVDESTVVNASGIAITPAKLREASEKTAGIMAGEVLDDIINQHYNNLLNALNVYQLPANPDAIYLHILLWYRQSKLRFISQTKEERHFAGENYENIFYKKQQNAAGKRLDAFMNHIGQYHAELFSLLSGGNVSAKTLSTVHLKYFDDDFQDYFANSPAQAQKWLLDSLNTTSWLTGGDIVVTDEKGKVIYNIQLKTTAAKYGKTFGVGTASLVSFVQELINLIDQDADVQKIAEYMFDKLKTEAANGLTTQEVKLSNAIFDEIYRNLGIK